MLLPDGQQRLRTRVRVIQYWDPAAGQSGKSFVLAIVRESQAQLASAQKIVFPSAFDGGLLEASVEYLTSRSGFEQNVVLESAIPLPSDLDPELNPARTRIQIWTEVLDVAGVNPKINTSIEQRGDDGRTVLRPNISTLTI